MFDGINVNLFDSINIQAMLHDWILQAPDWWSLIDEQSHGIIGIVIGGAISLFALTALYQALIGRE